MAENREEAGKAFALFLDKYEVKYPQAAECLEKDREELLAFYDFPAEPWKHIRTTNPIESTFATVGPVLGVQRFEATCVKLTFKLGTYYFSLGRLSDGLT